MYNIAHTTSIKLRLYVNLTRYFTGLKRIGFILMVRRGAGGTGREFNVYFHRQVNRWDRWDIVAVIVDWLE